MGDVTRLIGIYKVVTAFFVFMSTAFVVKLFIDREFLFGLFIFWMAFLAINYIWSNVSQDLKEAREGAPGARPVIHPATFGFFIRYKAVLFVVVVLPVVLTLKYVFIDEEMLKAMAAFGLSISVIFFLLDGYKHYKDGGNT
jgi:uncharacterized membrane protein YfcA